MSNVKITTVYSTHNPMKFLDTFVLMSQGISQDLDVILKGLFLIKQVLVPNV